MLQPRMITLHWSAMCIFTACTSPILEALLLGLGKFQGHFPLASTQPQNVGVRGQGGGFAGSPGSFAFCSLMPKVMDISPLIFRSFLWHSVAADVHIQCMYHTTGVEVCRRLHHDIRNCLFLTSCQPPYVSLVVLASFLKLVFSEILTSDFCCFRTVYSSVVLLNAAGTRSFFLCPPRSLD